MTTVSTPKTDPEAASSRLGTPLLAGVLTPTGAVMSGLIGLAFIGLFYRWLHRQHLHSSGSLEDWGHAYVIPIISIYLLWQQREAIAAAARRVYWPGLAPFMLGIMCYFFFVVGVPNHMLQGFAIILTLFGLVLTLVGTEMIRPLFLPIAYLAFGVTIAERIMIEITFQLQLIASQGGWVLLNIVGAVGGFSAEVSGNILTVIDSGGNEIPLNVAEACSGMRMVIAFIALAGAVALVACKEWWQRVLLLLLATPVALFMNIIRVGVLGVLSMWDPDLATGEAHMLIGTLLLVPALGLFLLVVWILNRIVDDQGGSGGGVDGSGSDISGADTSGRERKGGAAT